MVLSWKSTNPENPGSDNTKNPQFSQKNPQFSQKTTQFSKKMHFSCNFFLTYNVYLYTICHILHVKTFNKGKHIEN